MAVKDKKRIAEEESLRKIIAFTIQEFDKNPECKLTAYEVVNILQDAIKMVQFTINMTHAEGLTNLKKAPF